MSLLSSWMPVGASRWGWGLGLMAALGLVGSGWVRGDLRPAQLTQRAQASADTALMQAGFGWARLEVENSTGRLKGQAPDQDSLVQLQRAAAGLLAPYMGVPGVFLTLEQHLDVASAAPAASTKTASTPTAAAASAGGMVGSMGCERALRIAFSRTVIRFVPGSVAIDSPAARKAIGDVATVVKACPEWRVVVTGPIDSRAEVDGQLADQRARAAAAVLIMAGVPLQQIDTRRADANSTGASAVARVEMGRLDFRAVPAAATATATR